MMSDTVRNLVGIAAGLFLTAWVGISIARLRFGAGPKEKGDGDGPG